MDDFDSQYAFSTATDVHRIYKNVSFKNPNSIYNKPAPEIMTTAIIGLSLAVIMVILFFVRYHQKITNFQHPQLTFGMHIRAMIAAAIDNDSPVYTMVKITAQSIIFLAGIQVDYHVAFIVMLIFFGVESTLDSFRILLSVYENNDYKNIILMSERLRQDINEQSDTEKTTLQPTNVYEDLSRTGYVVVMVFITQFLLISFVVTDILHSSTYTCPDGTSGCPVGGTLGSWCFYCLGIFMAAVVLLGPKTNFGESEQNPAFWMQLLLFLKANHCQVQWTDKNTNKLMTVKMRPDDWRVWTRFLMSFIINGVGFRILVFALPIQIAAQSSLTGVVFRAVGMLYLVDIDDSPGYVLTFVDPDEQQAAKDAKETDDMEANESTALLKNGSAAAEAEAIIKEARNKLDALAKRKGL